MSQTFAIGMQHTFKTGRTRFGTIGQVCCAQPRYAGVHNMERVLRMSCQNANCEQERSGWLSIIDPEGDDGPTKMRAIESAGRHFYKLRSEDAPDWVAKYGASKGITDHLGVLAAVLARTPPGMVLYIFPPGQPCLRGHIDREVEFAHATPRSRYVHVNPKDFEEDMDETADRVGLLARG